MMAARLIRIANTGLILALALVLAACSGGRGGRGGGYYMDDGPPRNPPSNLDSVPDAVPRIEPLASGPNRPYTVMGKRYVPDTSERPYRRRGMASWYGKKFHGNPTSNGERYDMYAMTAAHTTLPIPSYVRVTRISNGRSVIVRVNDRGPFLHSRVIDLSYAAAHKLGMVGPGSAEVLVERITPDEIRAGTWDGSGGTFSVQAPPSATPVSMQSIPASTGSGGIFLQIGAFRDLNNARALASRAAGSAPPGKTVEIDQRTPGIYRVRIGPFESRDSALREASPIHRSIGVMPSISTL
ncbi:septal ring lytic transglycosylase RlpA family protein [Orrella marina]|uniref:Endolytic peptidoglycan transglycosylase RlpA n=1 Tax=Orrella marina TaxID=2163011 RepID=A0A2R4XL21_9BURK|nr:septal ring lytic transglycosylase RlpA family protein [Orrella marina]AWB34508.1 septal ring lytic transglycosylase RlpA family lipoprotein [Orrella marina]